MHSSRRLTVHFNGRLSCMHPCHARSPYHAHPLAMHALSGHTHSPAMHTPFCHVCPLFTTHTPLCHTPPLCLTCPSLPPTPPPPVNRITDRCKKNYLPAPSFASSNKRKGYLRALHVSLCSST